MYIPSVSGKATTRLSLRCSNLTVEHYIILCRILLQIKFIFAHDEDLQDENSKLRALISNNFGRRKNDPAKDRKALETYVSLRGYKQGELGRNHFQTCQNGTSEKSTLDEIAKELNMSKRNLQRALRIERNLTDSMKELLDTGEIIFLIIYVN